MKYNFSKRTDHFTLPKQWDSMRVAKKLEKETGKKIIHFEKGDYQGSDFETPEHILKATVDALEAGYVRYDPGPGLPELREHIAHEVMKDRRPGTKPEEVIICAGAKNALTMTLLTLLEDGDHVIFPNPGYPPDEVWAKYANAKIDHTPLNQADWQYDLDKLDAMITDKTKLLIINTPQRPNGQIVENPEAIAEIVLKHPNLLVITDEIFSQVIYDGKKHKTISSIPEMKDRCIVIDTWSKTYAMTGWRLGYSVWPNSLLEYANRLCVNNHSCVNTASQYAGLAALKGPQTVVNEMLLEFDKRRKFIISALNDIPGISCKEPGGAFYVFPNIKNTGFSSQQAQDDFLELSGVAAISGTSFGKMGEGYIRFSYANSLDKIEEAIERIKKLLLK